MKLKLTRLTEMATCTIGKLLIDDSDLGIWTLEPVVREPGVKIQNKTAILSAIYKVTIDPSQRFQRDMPHILDVPYFEGVRIHWGNTDVDTDGCVLLGLIWDGHTEFIGKSRDAFDLFFPKLQVGVASPEGVTIEILDV